ncbi:MAG: amidohydrolase [Bacillota bacterium]|nr:amidohydrolase [Bacillota bacterium]MDW7676321.1 amidohydrolase [Bacillota bacterium]
MRTEITTPIENYVQTMYWKLHALPEKSFQEVNTAALITSELMAMGLEVQTGIAQTGVVARLSAPVPGPVIALRADMDALCFVRNHTEVMVHACGHDAHSAMVLGAARLLAADPPRKGTVLFLFQPSEEKGDGSRRVIASGVLDDVEEMVGIHVRPADELPAGQATPALLHGAVQIIRAVIHGTNAHGARPHLGVNALEAAVLAVNALNALHFDPKIQHSLKVTRLLVEGETYNLIPDQAEIHIDVRAQTNELMHDMTQKISRAISRSAGALGAETMIDTVDHTPAAAYDEALIQTAAGAIREVLGSSLPPQVTAGSEDFHFYAAHLGMKTAYIGLGAGVTPGLHHPDFKLEEDQLIHGTRILETIVRKRLETGSEPA